MSTVRFHNVSKKFTLHRERSRSLQELFLNTVQRRRRSVKEDYWALHGVSFEIKAGEMVGIIGPNGAGKSTILKLIARIIEPTSGDIEINGSVGALLELGAGFHPDLTGRENIYLNGSILGFNRTKMDSIYDDILAFSRMGRFIDVPVKHYSSGMYMRLGFSIAIHLQPDILLVDEVLAVGDKAFQLRCLDKINEIRRQGVSIILVTHDLDSVRDMCDRAIWLDEGQIRTEGPVEPVLDQYMTQVFIDSEQTLLAAESTRLEGQLADTSCSDTEDAQVRAQGRPAWRWGSREAEIVRVRLLDEQGQERRVFMTGETMIVRMHFAACQRIEKPQFGLAFHHANGFHISGPNTVFSGVDIKAIEGEGYIDYAIDGLPLLAGTYLLSVALYDYEGVHAYDHHHQAFTFRVRPNKAIREEFGTLLIPAEWRLGPAGFVDSGNEPDDQP